MSEGTVLREYTLSYGDAIPAQEKPTREGYTFVSWDKNVPDTVSDENCTELDFDSFKLQVSVTKA